MGIFSKLFGGSGNDGSGDHGSVYDDEIVECQLCGEEGSYSRDMINVDIEFPQGHVSMVCEDCFDREDMGSGMTSYCCGMIYEEGELACASCGDPL